jgi:hypothetical protein
MKVLLATGNPKKSVKITEYDPEPVAIGTVKEPTTFPFTSWLQVSVGSKPNGAASWAHGFVADPGVGVKPEPAKFTSVVGPPEGTERAICGTTLNGHTVNPKGGSRPGVP